MAAAPQLTASTSGDVLELRPGGSWTAANVTTLEPLSDAVTAELDRSKTVRLDMVGVRELDTLGAWLHRIVGTNCRQGGKSRCVGSVRTERKV